jgi:hypothetical protein
MPRTVRRWNSYRPSKSGRVMARISRSSQTMDRPRSAVSIPGAWGSRTVRRRDLVTAICYQIVVMYLVLAAAAVAALVPTHHRTSAAWHHSWHKMADTHGESRARWGRQCC